MAIDSISSIPPVIDLAPMTQADSVQASGAAENSVQPNASAISAESSVYTPGNPGNLQAPVAPVAIDVEGSLPGGKC